MYCGECGGKIKKGNLFCPSCGCQFEEVLCPECGEIKQNSDSFCENCGYSFIKSRNKKSGNNIMCLVVSIFCFLVSAVLYVVGDNMNNDLETNLEYLFNDGTLNPGASYQNAALIMVVIAIILLVVHFAICNKETK